METLKPTPLFDWFITSPSLPRVQAFYEPPPVQALSPIYYSETFASSNLTVPEGSFLLLICAAFYNITWTSSGGRGSNDRATVESNWCRGVITDTAEQRPSTECLRFESLRPDDSGVYTCHHAEEPMDPSLITTIELRVMPTENSSVKKKGGPRVIKRSFDNVFTLTPRPIELTVEYELDSTAASCSDDDAQCRGSWYMPGPQIVLDGRLNTSTNHVSASSEIARYSYVEYEMLTSSRYRSRLIVPQTCYKNSGFYRFLLPSTNESVDFNVTVQFLPIRSVELDDPDQKNVKFVARLYRDREYEIRCWTKDFGPNATNKTMTLEFYDSQDIDGAHQCGSSPTFAQSSTPVGGFVMATNEMEYDTPMCVEPGEPLGKVTIGVYYSAFTMRAERPGMVRCTVDWTYLDSTMNNASRRNTSVTELRYKVVDREDLLPIGSSLVIERYPKHEIPLIGEPMTVRCVATTCQYDKITLAKDSQKVQFSDDNGIVYNDFGDDEAEVSYENTSMRIVLSLTLKKPSKLASGVYSCIGSDHEIPLPGKMDLEVFMVPPSQPSFPRQNYTDKVLLEAGTHVTLSCDPSGLPKPEIRWYLDGEPWSPTDDGVTLADDNTTLTADKIGRYECLASNKFGQVRRSFNVVSEDDEKRTYVAQIVVGTVCGIALLGSVCFAVWWIRRLRLASLKRLHTLMLKPATETIPLESFMPVNDQIESLPYDEKYEVDKEKVSMSEVLGSGEYGKVYRGLLKLRNGDHDIAVKVPRDGLNAEHHRALLSELKIMIYVRQHINVLRVLGACTKDVQGGFYIIAEYCDRGSLRDYLIKNRERSCSSCGTIAMERGSRYAKNIQMFQANESDLKSDPIKHCYVNVQEGHQCSYFSVEILLSYAYQAACGMEYLAAKNVVHRDLALRNLLLHGDVVKIADFGLSRHHYRDVYKSRKYDTPLPVFWMALESILSYKYTEKSDVWSFGVVLWELFSLGEPPYPGKRPDHQFVQWLREGNRMDSPKLAPDESYKLMMSCWNKNPDSRPTFSECKRNLGQHFDETSRDGYRACLVALASAMAISDELQFDSNDSSRSSSSTTSHTPTKETSGEEEQHSARYAIFGGSEAAANKSNGQLSTTSDLLGRSSCESLSNSEIEKLRMTMIPSSETSKSETNIYQAPYIPHV